MRVDADHVFDVAPRWRLSPATAATHSPTLGVVDALVDDVVAPRWSLSSASAAAHWPALDVGDVLVDGVKEFSTGNIALFPFERWKLQSTSSPRRCDQAKTKFGELVLRVPLRCRSVLIVVVLVKGDLVLRLVDLEIDTSSAS